MGIHGKSSNLKATANTRNARRFRKARARERLNGKRREGDIRPSDRGIIPEGILRRRKTNPFAPIDLSGKRKRKIMKVMRRKEKASKVMEVMETVKEKDLKQKTKSLNVEEKSEVHVSNKMELN